MPISSFIPQSDDMRPTTQPRPLDSTTYDTSTADSQEALSPDTVSLLGPKRGQLSGDMATAFNDSSHSNVSDLDHSIVAVVSPKSHVGQTAAPTEANPHEAKILRGMNYGTEMEAAAKKHGIDPVLLAAVAAQESGGGGIQARNIDQPDGQGCGPFQIDIGAWPKQASIAHDPAKSADFAASLLKDGYRQADLAHDARSPVERTMEALRTYNGGSPHAKTTTTQWPDGRIPYEESVLRHYQQIKSYLASPASQR